MITTHITEGICSICLSRPDKANALTAAMLYDIESSVARAELEQARVLILTGEGRVFSAGADLDEARAGLATDPVWDRVSARIAGFSGLSIAALNGTLAGGAFGMALACDLRIATPQAAFFYPVMRLGYLPQPADPARLARLIGPARARMILLAGARVTAAEALAWGLIDRVTDPEALLETARQLAADALAATPSHLQAIKAMIPNS